ncbi:RelA/SpoT family protein [Buchananella hordeovulneris]|uniref:Bifunctional (P)ppGpp synthetase/guanosine-3',5'-bis(Diphosphate) 3'-pyrophosphohydrolase n=1 Tax=Buchananella hordeovulneris TaxID=52770 RepID=A0A1Q5PYI7_9ACTO|nr:bifunctional (p)ppGpp synthetase/guanosine-3',5'-bis(diphosphate) 3'-pyrophosphohydrolase [Buchananella hordeovulneris]OKL52450.1 hypothetical protein BSZ40_03000 [Buchananella hordeovulneris]
MADVRDMSRHRGRGRSWLETFGLGSSTKSVVPVASTPALVPIANAVAEHSDGSPIDFALIERAYQVAEKAHRGQFRKSGEPYITHPVAVATILAGIGLTPITIAAALLHDTVEDTDYSLEQLRTDFGDEIALLVDGVTKLDKVEFGQAAKGETVRKMVIAMAKDIRVLMIKLGDRLHNARTWKYMEAGRAKAKAEETLEIYAPLAHRFGMNAIKWELEDLSFKQLYPGRYEEIEDLVKRRAPEREAYLEQLSSRIKEQLTALGITGVVTGRPKHYYSIYQKMVVRGREFDDIYDLVALRVLVDTVGECYAVLGKLHEAWKPVTGRFKDYIALPKYGVYQSLHTTVIGPEGKPVEIQIRTHEMHRRAEYGVAAHWKYKANPTAAKREALRTQSGKAGDLPPGASEMTWLKGLFEWQQETGDPNEFLDSLRYEMSGNEVYVFTPQGDVIALPRQSTPVDFAYAVHTEVGHRTVGAKINGRLVSLDTQVDNGDTVEVITSKAQDAGPNEDWLAFVASPRARSKIKSWFTKERREDAIEEGKNRVAKMLRRQNLPIQRLMTHHSLLAVAQEMGYPDVSGLYAAIGESHVSAESITTKLMAILGGDAGTEETLAEATVPRPRKRHGSKAGAGIIIENMKPGEMWTKIAQCCTPAPGDPICGFITRGNGISIHHADCENIEALANQPERLVQARWDLERPGGFIVQVVVEALDRAGLLNDITRSLLENRVDIVSASFTAEDDQIAIGRLAFEVGDQSHLEHVLKVMRKVPGVYDVRRAFAGRREADES